MRSTEKAPELPAGHSHLDLTARAVRSACFDDLLVGAVEDMIAGGTLPPSYAVMLTVAGLVLSGLVLALCPTAMPVNIETVPVGDDGKPVAGRMYPPEGWHCLSVSRS